MHCPRCGYSDSATNNGGDIDIVIRKLGAKPFDSPYHLTRSGLYVTGENEDGKSILTRWEEPVDEEF